MNLTPPIQQVLADLGRLPDAPPLPLDLVKWWRRVRDLERGKVYLLTVTIPEAREDEIQWSILGAGKTENR